jgi:hypothetical protein
MVGKWCSGITCYAIKAANGGAPWPASLTELRCDMVRRYGRSYLVQSYLRCKTVWPVLGGDCGTLRVTTSTFQRRRMRNVLNQKHIETTYLDLSPKLVPPSLHGFWALSHYDEMRFSDMASLKSAVFSTKVQKNNVDLPMLCLVLIWLGLSSSFDIYLHTIYGVSQFWSCGSRVYPCRKSTTSFVWISYTFLKIYETGFGENISVAEYFDSKLGESDLVKLFHFSVRSGILGLLMLHQRGYTNVLPHSF